MFGNTAPYPGEIEAFGSAWCGPEAYTYRHEHLVARYESPPDQEGQTVEVFCKTLPSHFYKLRVTEDTDYLGAILPAYEVEIGSSMYQLAADVAGAIADGLFTVTPAQTDGWSDEAPTEPGSYWLYGDEEFGTMGGNYSGSIPPELQLHYVTVVEISNTVVGVTNGRFISLRPFDFEKRRSGYVGKWKKVDLPALPEVTLPNIPTA